jgi:serine/threonine protein kinase
MQTERTYDELKSVLFQIIYTAESLYRAGIRHNDLHVGNVLIDVNATSDKLYYQLSANRKFAAPARRSLVKICDFDSACGIRSQRSRSHLSGPMPSYYNYRLKYYKYWHQYGMTDVDNPRYDTFTILSSMAGALRKYHGSSEFTDLITERFIISRPLLQCPWKFAHRMGKKKDGTFFHNSQNADRSDYVPDDEEVRSNMAILNDNAFADWRIAPEHFNALSMEQRGDVYVLPGQPTGAA